MGGELATLRQRLRPYPESLRRSDATYVAGCLFRVVTLRAADVRRLDR